jgi:DMSO/TMAO reductase YedYZ molybdopterin-dependent catalytic subunit
MSQLAVLLLRHGETTLNTTDALRGRLDVPLETAAIVSAAIGVAAVEHPSFIDVDYGRWAGIPLNAFLERDRGEVKPCASTLHLGVQSWSSAAASRKSRVVIWPTSWLHSCTVTLPQRTWRSG